MSRKGDAPHARVYASWLLLPSWKGLSHVAKVLLLYMLADYRPGVNVELIWPVRRAARSLGASKDTAARALHELEDNGWIEAVRVGRYGRARGTTYQLTMYPSVEGAPPSHAYRGERLPSRAKAKKAA